MSFAGRRQLFRQPPRISVLLQSVNHVIGDEVALLLAEPLAESPHKLARPYESKGEREPKHVAAGPHCLRRRGQWWQWVSFNCGGGGSRYD